MAKKLINKKGNYTTIQNELINDKSISLKAKGILLYMLSKPFDWKYNPKEIAANSKDGLDSVYSGLKELIEAGYVSRKRYADGRVDYYVFEDKSENDIEDFSLKEENPNRENPNRENPNRENPNRENPNRDFPDVYKRKNTTKERIIVIKEYIYNSERFLETYDDFKKMRKTIKKPMTERAEKLLLKKLEEMTNGDEETAIKILEQSILYNWQGIFELKGENDGNGKRKFNTGYSNKNDKHSEKVDRTNDGKGWN